MIEDMLPIKCNRCKRDCLYQGMSADTYVPLCLDCLEKRRQYLKEAYESYKEKSSQLNKMYSTRYEQ